MNTKDLIPYNFFHFAFPGRKRQEPRNYKFAKYFISKIQICLSIMQIFIDNAGQLLQQIWKDKNIHIVQKQYTLGRDKFSLIDFSMNAQGQDEDKMYIDSNFYRTNIRRGNTLVEVIDNKGKKKVMWGRKGTQKIIDIRLQYLENITRGGQLNKDEKKATDVIFKNVNKCFENGKRVQLLKTQKANGQNAQVSYFYQLDAWIICSENVSIVASCLKDLQIYDGKRYTYAKAIARQWFKQIQTLNKQKIIKLKKLLDGFSLVGQYCGNPEYQHLILYNEIRIIWFALIDNYSEDYCIDPFQVRKDIEEFGFKFVKLKRLGSWNDKKNFYQQLENLYLRIAQASMQDQQYGMEGAIVYFLSSEFKNNKPSTKVLGSGKLKTIQYRFFRKIRQKLSRYLNRKQSQAELLKKYELQCEELQKANFSPAPYPQFYYTQILQKGCQLIRQSKITQDFLRSKFVSVLKLLFYVIYKNINLKAFGNRLIKNQKFLQEITKISLSDYGAMGCNTKIVYVPIDLPGILDKTLSQQLSVHFNKLKLKYQTIDNQEGNNVVEKAFTLINNSSIGDQKTSFLMHFYINDNLKIQQVHKIVEKLKYKGKKNVYHQFVLITDDYNIQQSFKDNNHNEYPFKLETIIYSYWKVYQQVKNTPTIQQKIDQLIKTSYRLKSKKDYIQYIEKHGFKKFLFKMSGYTKLQETQKSELNKIISNIINNQKQYENYCRLILKLDKYTDTTFLLLNQNQRNDQAKNLIKCSFSPIPEMDFTQNI